MSLWRRPVCQALDISSATAGVDIDLLNVLVILSKATVRLSIVEWEDLKSLWKLE